MSDTIRNYGWKRDLPDFRDHKFALDTPTTLPDSVDLRPNMPPVYDQGQLGSCTGNAIAAAIEYDQKKNNMPSVYVPSRLFIYFQERTIENTVTQDSGAQIRDGVKACNTVGACTENSWPYDIGKFTENPPTDCYTEAGEHKIVSYKSVNQDLTSLQTALAAGYPIVFGFSVYDSFESHDVAVTGVVPMPNSSESCLGGHAVLICGYDNATKRFLVRNSWGPGWGNGGYFTIPYDYVVNPDLADDFWTITVTN